MKIALVVPGGVDRSGVRRVIPCLLWLIERLARDHELHVFALLQDPEPSRYPLLGATVHNIGARPRRLRTVAAILREHARAPFDVLHAVWGVHPGVVAAAASRIMGTPLVLHLTGGDLASIPEIGYGALRSRRGRSWLRFAAGRARHVTTPSQTMRDAARALGLEPEKLPLGVALDRWPPRAPRPRDPGAPGRLLFVGTLNRVKDPVTLIRAAVCLRAEGVAFELDIVGEDTLGGEIQRLARSASVGEGIRFHGFVPHPELRAYVERADVLVVTSLHEADPVVALEAAVAGVPTVGSAVGHIADWAPEAAVAVPVGNPEALARAVASLLTDDDQRLALATAAQARALAADADRTANRFEEIYREVRDG